ncbi:DUF2721 domain-containing protein [Prosthecochloris sp. HL-130-GSB]|jgi:hypothetical protein|uniref:DUF2721 domain-containing protein n=1 Tax=Prosthecochloris aestuarii TaxID=1102 RepID=A0A831SQR6_PROAE|nr:DUF2721 domain-containing protein [Prosthecochloris sp. HL-130-GSB]ARM31217.1 hypothetical protein B9H02_07840 [Prosthecochloris sp. HL-130-GSB]MBO8092500.1 DUF2721 domain-containing protein [Prosthecochloris sp.]HED30212.1 DUF2721 domain-containing protein [Prosthecochloris aestuarii]
MEHLEHITALIQTAIGPVILVSGMGLLLLTMTNRLGRIIDRSRAMSHELDAMGSVDRQRIEAEIDILWSRARYIRIAIMLVVLSCLSASLLVIVLFLAPLTDLDQPVVISVLFVAAMVFLISSLIFFLLDVNRTLSALRIELDAHRGRKDSV